MRRILFLCLMMICTLPAGASDRVFDKPLFGGDIMQRVLLSTPPHPRGTLIMLPGGAGDIGIMPDGSLKHPHNFLVRTKSQWLKRGYAVLIPDTVQGRNLRGLRSSPGYGRIVGELVKFAHNWTKGPVFLIGTSQGTIAAMNGATRAKPGSIAGVVLTEAVTVRGGSHETVFDAQPEKVRVPVLIIANDKDRCRVTPPGNAGKIRAALTTSPDVQIVRISGGADKDGKSCGSLSPHGYYGAEAEVIGKIASWLDARNSTR